MFKANLRTRNLRTALLTGAATATVFAFVGPASAQEAQGGTETVVVTGSRIPQTGLVSVSPVSTVTQQEAKFEGTTNIESLLNNLPQVFAGQTNTVTNGATGTATVDLRGLGAARTLVLIDGVRLMPGDPVVPLPDLNQIPAAMVERVEVETGGASAVYGSDALAGVVNFIMRKDFEGLEVDGQWSEFNADNDSSVDMARLAPHDFAQAPQNIWDGQSIDGTVIFGANTDNGKGNVTGYVGYKHDDAVFESQRDFSACTYGVGGPGGLGCAGSSNFNRFFSLDTGNDYFEQSGANAGNFVNYTGSPSQKFNYGALNTLQRPDSRWTGGFFAHYEINKYFDVYSNFMFMDDDSVGSIAPSGLFLGSGTVSGFAQQINCANPLMTAQQRTALCGANGLGTNNIFPGFATLEIGRRNVEGGLRQSELHHTSWRVVEGVKGDLGDGWTYDLYGMFGRSNFVTATQGFWSRANIQNALDVVLVNGVPTCVVGGACVPLDIFHGDGAVTPAMEKYLYETSIVQGFTNEHVVSGQLTGDLGSIGFQSPWAKDPVGVAFGGEYRDEGLELLPDGTAESGDLSGSGGKTAPQPFASYSVREGFGEVRVPIIEDAPFAKLLQVNGAYRYSDYSSAGQTNTYEYGAEWQPIDDFRLRASYQRAVRAPNVLELFAPDNVVLTSGTFNDICAGVGGAPVPAKCFTATGGASTHGNAGNSALLSCPASQCNQLVGGNINVKPEISDTRTAGVVLTPTFIPGFSATVDYFDIRVSGAIGTVGVQTILNECYIDGIQAFCNLVDRNSEGQIYGSGHVTNLNLNTGSLQTKGWDFEANYSTDLSDWGMGNNGSLAFAFNGTLLDNLVTVPLPGLPAVECAGLYGDFCGTPNPKWRHKFRVTWASPWDVDVSAQWRYFSSVGGYQAASIEPFPSVSYIDLAVSWHVWESTELRAGVNNVFDVSPPVTAFAGTAPGNGNTFPGVYDSLGRYVFVGATVKL